MEIHSNDPFSSAPLDQHFVCYRIAAISHASESLDLHSRSPNDKWRRRAGTDRKRRPPPTGPFTRPVIVLVIFHPVTMLKGFLLE